MTEWAELPDTAVRLPRARLGIAVVGYGRVARRWHVPTYRRAGLNVVAICDRDEAALEQAALDWPDVRRYRSVSELLSDRHVAVLDLATRPSGRLALIRQAVLAGRHVLAQKPLAADLSGIDELVNLAADAGVQVAVNQNGRFAPAWWTTTQLLRSGEIGPLRAVTHVFDTHLRWVPDPARHGTTRFLLFDYANHWIDICGYWLDPDPVVAVQAMDYDTVHHPDGGLQQSMWISMETEAGVSILIRGAAAGISHLGHHFIVQGAKGTLRGAVDSIPGESLELDDGKERRALALQGAWFGDGFLGAMVELLRAIEEGRPPDHSLADNRRTIALVAAVCASARARGARVVPETPARATRGKELAGA